MALRKLISVVGLSLLLIGNATAQSSHGAAANDYLNFYRKCLSNMSPTHCRMYPSCSRYASMVFEDYSFPQAMVLTADRLTRCGHDARQYPQTYLYGFRASVDYPQSREVPDGVVYKPHTRVVPMDSYGLSTGKVPIFRRSLRFVERLMIDENYAGALLEIERLCFEQGDSLSMEEMSLLLGDKLKCYEALGEYSKAVLEYESRFPVVLRHEPSIQSSAARFYDLLGDSRRALDLYEQSVSTLPRAEVYGKIGTLYAGMGDSQSAVVSFEDKLALDGNKSSYDSSVVLVNSLQDMRYKSAPLAAVLSIVPGLGYLYDNQAENAITSLLVTSALAYASYTSFRSGNYGVGAIVSLLGVSFYFGNAYGAYRGAERYNASIKEAALDNLRKLNP